MIDWKSPLKTIDGLKAVRIHVLEKSDYPNVLKYTNVQGEEKIKSVDDNGHDGQMFFILNASSSTNAWHANRQIMLGVLNNIDCSKCGGSLKESSRTKNETRPDATLYADCRGCKTEYTLSLKKEKS